MVRHPLVLVFAAVMVASGTTAQGFAPRSADYLFAATADDARAAWVNPAGLAALPEASVMAELVVQRPDDASLRVSQLSIGFNSQGLAFGYYRERLPGDSAIHTYRVGLARALRGWTVGVAVSHLRSGANATGFDAGIRYRLLRSLHLGLVLRNIGQPIVRGDTLPLTAVAGLGWAAVPRTLMLCAETIAQTRTWRGGYDMAYRAGATLALPIRTPFRVLTAALLDSHFGVSSWHFGMVVGRARAAVAVASVTPAEATARVETLSITALATNDLTQRR